MSLATSAKWLKIDGLWPSSKISDTWGIDGLFLGYQGLYEKKKTCHNGLDPTRRWGPGLRGKKEGQKKAPPKKGDWP